MLTVAFIFLVSFAVIDAVWERNRFLRMKNGWERQRREEWHAIQREVLGVNLEFDSAGWTGR